MNRFLSIAILIASCLPALAQTGTPTKQSGNVTPQHGVCWTTNGIVQDCGTAAVPFLTSIGTVGQGQTICAWTALSTAPGSQSLCLGVFDSSAATITLQNFGLDTPQSLNFVINGTTYPFPFTVGGIVGPSTSTVGDVAIWNNTTGSLLKDVPPLQIFGTESANCVFAGPTTGSAAFPTCRSLVSADIAAILPAGIDQNLLNSQTTGYTVANTDCGKTILAGTGSTGQFTLTLPSVSGFPTTCSVLIKNGDTTNGKILAGFPSDLAPMLYPGQSVGVKVVNGAWASFYNPGAYNPNGSVTLFASTTGSASNDCLTSATACTLAVACNSFSKIYVSNSQVTINVADGTYSTPDARNALCSFVGDSGGTSNALTFLIGNCTTPSNVVFSIPDNDSGVFVKDFGQTEIECIKFQGAGSGTTVGISAGQFAIVDVIKTVWGTFGSNSILLNFFQSASLNIDGVASMTLNAAPGGNGTVISLASGSNVTSGAGATIVIPSALVWGGQFLQVYGTTTAQLTGMTFTGSGVGGTTGKRASLIGNAFLATGGISCNTFFPGNGACTLIQGAEDDASDPLTTPCPVASGCTGVSTTSGIQALVAPGLLYYTLAGINFNSATTDNIIPLTNFPTGMTRFQVDRAVISNASHTLVTATIGIFTTTGGSGTVAADQAIAVSSTSDATNNNSMSLTLTNAATTAYVLANLAHTPNLYARIGTPEGAAATGDVTLEIRPLP